MPKDWKRHKAELKRLYIIENKPLKEVQQILRDRHGFIASIRAYRMRLDDWGLRKYSTNRDEQTIRPPPRSGYFALDQEPDIAARESGSNLGHFSDDDDDDDDDEDDYIKFPGGIAIPKRPLKVVDLLAFIPQNSKHTFEILLMKWQKDEEYLKVMTGLLKKVEYRDYIWRRTTVVTPSQWLLNLVQRKASHTEQIILIKLFLQAVSFLPIALGMNGRTLGISNWTLALEKVSWSWEGAKSLLYRDGEFCTAFGQKAVKCALVVLAETRLQRIKGSFSYDPPLRGTCQEYLKILKDFDNAEIDIDQAWYKYALRISKEYETISVEQANEKQLKHRQLIALYTGIAEENVDGKLEELLKAEAEKRSRSKKGSNDFLIGNACHQSSLPNHSNEHANTLSIHNGQSVGTPDSTTSAARSTLKELLGLYRSGVELNAEIVHSTLSGMSYVRPLYDRDIFKLIPEEVEEKDRISFATALMRACFRDKFEHSLWPVFLGASFSLQTLESLCAAQSWEQFQRDFKPIERAISRFDEMRWSPASSNFVPLLSQCMVNVSNSIFRF